MKKSKLSITLVTSFIAAMALTACKEVTASKNAIVTFTPYGSKESIALITDDMYNAYRNDSSGVTKFYEKILEVLIRYEFKEKGFADGDMKYAEIETWAKNQVQEQKDKAKANAKSNKTSYDDEWKAILESKGVEDADELKESYIYEKEKEVMTNWYAVSTEKAETLKKEFIGIDASGNAIADSKVKAAMPYHIRHILVKVDEASDATEKFYKGTISESQAKLLADTVSTLASGKYTFSQVASMYSEDGSASSGGDVGIMTNTATSGSLGMVNEFQLGLYAYDNIYNATNAAKAGASVIKDNLGITADVESALPTEAVEVPYEAFVNIGKYAEVIADQQGNKLADGSSTLYPRNILWNKYLNLHNVFLIKNAVSGEAHFGDSDEDTIKEEFTKLAGTTAYDANLPRFNADGYLVDENDNIIIGVRSQYGIHFMIIERSMYDYDAETSLETYYSTKLPGEDGYSKDSYVGFIQSQSKEDYKKRADDVKSKITSFDSTYDYRLYDYLTSDVKIEYADSVKDLGEKIDQYIAIKQDDNAYKQEDGLKKVWRTYTEMLDLQEYNRSAWYITNNTEGGESPKLTRLVSEQIAEDFFKLYEDSSTNKALYDLFAEGGPYYYYAK